MNMAPCWSKFTAIVFEYNTPKIVHIRSKKVGVLSRLIQLAVICYIIGYVIIFKKGYQETSPIQSAVITKVKGIGFTNFSLDEFKDKVPDKSLYNRIWDVADYVVPPDMNDAFFVTTNLIITPQSRGICNENAIEVPDAECSGPQSHDCVKGKTIETGNGVQTGRCTKTTPYLSKTGYSCEIRAWCKVEMDTVPLKDKNKAILDQTANFTVLIKNTVIFTAFKVMRRNIAEDTNKNYLRQCHYDAKDNPLCPIFKLGDIVRIADKRSGTNYSSIAAKGGVIGITVKWDCNLDYSADDCKPAYSFARLDNPEAKLGKGWNFRYARYYSYTRRTLFKAYGIKFVLNVQAKAGQFRIKPLVLNIASGLALLGITVVICDFVVLYVLKSKSYYQDQKYQIVDVDEQDHEVPYVNSLV